MTEGNTQQSADNMTVDAVTEQVEEGRKHHSSHHHHSKHSHHKHHRHRRRSKSAPKKKNKFVAFLKQNRSVLINILSCTVSVVLILIMALNADFAKPDKAENSHTDVTQTTIKIETSLYSGKIRLVSNAVSQYMDPGNDASIGDVYKSFGGYKAKLNEGLPLVFTYRVTGLPVGYEIQDAELELSEHEDYHDSQTYRLDLEQSNINIYNLKTGTKYYYRVQVTLGDGQVIGTTGSFETEASPRILKIDGIVNVRDIGGWVTEDGQTVRQGLLYRGSELDGAVQPDYLLTDRGLQQMIGELGIRFDMDLRGSHENPSGVDALGKNVVHKYYGVDMYSRLLSETHAAGLKRIFSDLADPGNYPIYLHCTYGRDRTGSVCYLLEALLGMSKEDLIKEYELSALTDSYVNTPEFNLFTEMVNAFEGDDTKSKVEGYLLSIGVTAEEIASIRNIFLGE